MSNPRHRAGILALLLTIPAPLAAGQTPADETVSSAMVLSQPDLPEALQTARDLEASVRYQEALDAYDGFLAEQPDHVAGLLLRGRFLADLGRQEAALEDLVRCARLAPDEPAVRLALGTLLHAQGQFTDATLEFHACLERAPQDALVRHLLGTLEKEAGRLVHARRYFQAAVALQPEWMMPRVGEAEMAFHLGDRTQARTMLTAVVEEDPTQWEAHLVLADLFLSLNCRAAAARSLVEVIRSEGEESKEVRVKALGRLGFLYRDIGEDERAIACLEAAILDSNQPLPVFDDLARLYRRADRVDDAVSLLRLALRLDERLQHRMELAAILESRGEAGAALEELRAARRTGARSPDLLWHLARLEEQCGSGEAAQEVFAEMLKVGEDHPAWNSRPGYLVLVAERSFSSSLGKVASVQRGLDCLGTLRRLAADMGQEDLRHLASAIASTGLPEDFLFNGPSGSRAPILQRD